MLAIYEIVMIGNCKTCLHSRTNLKCVRPIKKLVNNVRNNKVCQVIKNNVVFTHQDYESQRERKRPLYQKIHDVADELVKHPKATDVSEVKTILTNVKLNWDCLDTSLAKR